jgi:hypothetical protein
MKHLIFSKCPKLNGHVGNERWNEGKKKYLKNCFFCLSGFWTGPEHRESNLTVLCLLGDNKWPVRPLGGELQCGGLRPLCAGLELGGSSVEEGVAQPA